MSVAAFATPASADHHQMKVREVFTGADVNDDYVELQMYSSAENFVGGHNLQSFDATGTLVDNFEFPGDAATGGSQRTILVGDTEAAGTPDFTDEMLDNSGLGGAVCFVSDTFGAIDCVSWGSFSGSLPSPAGTPAGALGPTTALRRQITPGCNTLLEAGDDTNDSATDFGFAEPNPRNNSVLPVETACPNTSITKGPDGKTTDRTPTFKFKSTPGGADFECKVDARDYDPCESPETLRRQSLGKHTFRVRAIQGDSIDPTPAKRRFKVIKRK